MGNKGRWEYLRAIYERYRKAERKAKKVILGEFCENTGYHRKYAIRLLSGPPPEKRRSRQERRRRATYSQETLAVLTAVWEAAGYQDSTAHVAIDHESQSPKHALLLDGALALEESANPAR